MARLKAKGRTELARVEKESTPAEGLTDWERSTFALMSDRTLLKKHDVRFRSDGSKHTYGWKKHAVLAEGVTVERFIASFESRGYRKVPS